jgi:hypothetical protein
MVSESMQKQFFDSTDGNYVSSLHQRIHFLELSLMKKENILKQWQKEKDNKLSIHEAALREKNQQLQELW